MFSSSQAPVIYLSMSDSSHPLSAFSSFGFDLDDAHWSSVAHYFHASKFEDAEIRSQIKAAQSPHEAEKIAKKHKRKIKKDWRSTERILMTRAIYVRCRTHQSVASVLLDTGDIKIIENSQYDYYWGCGRDLRGKNNFGKVLMEVREKLRELTR